MLVAASRTRVGIFSGFWPPFKFTEKLWSPIIIAYICIYWYYRMGKQIENYSLQVELGSGVYSRVFKAVHMVTKQEVAIKMVKADKFKEMPKLE